jgi:hypothetical protein
MVTYPNKALQVDMSGNDEVVANERTRATVTPIVLTGTAGLGAAYSTNSQGQLWMNGFGPARSGSSGAAFTALAADLLTGIITWKNTNTANSNMTLDSAANLLTTVNQLTSGAQVGDVVVQTLVINSTGSGAGGTITIVPGAGGSLDANQSAPVIAVGASRFIYIVFTNVTVGSAAYTVYT